jgi:hypothetical protein
MALIGLRKDGTRSVSRLPEVLLSQSSEKSPQKFTHFLFLTNPACHNTGLSLKNRHLSS